MKILDCTLRDGGYYTNWDFNRDLVKIYLEAMNQLPIDYLEVGYRSKAMEGYFGEYFYCPTYVLKELKRISHKKLVIILNEKDVTINDLPELLNPIKGLVTMVRMAIDPKNLIRAVETAKEIKKMGFEVGFNVMYMSKWNQDKSFLEQISAVDGVADYFYMVDSYGGVYPEDVKEIAELVKNKTKSKLGFHGHNNLELGLINTLTALETGAKMVDVTITGMGRGAGNLKTELLLTALNAKQGLEVNFNALSAVVDAFTALQKQYDWGTNLPYMVSGANSLPQKDVMDWMGKRYYSLNSIIRALDNQARGEKDNIKLPILSIDKERVEILLIGGGNSVKQHERAIKEFLRQKTNTIIIHASSKNALSFNDLDNQQYFCLVGNEGLRMERIFGDELPKKFFCILPPHPRIMGTYVPKKLANKAYELQEIIFTDKHQDSHTAIALKVASLFDVSTLFVVGYDGYHGVNVSQKEQDLYEENQYLFERFKAYFNVNLVTLTPSAYSQFRAESIYEKL
ncbi:MAG: aldolase catalytic domain-containing protein [Luteibaculaceae bacterium]